MPRPRRASARSLCLTPAQSKLREDLRRIFYGYKKSKDESEFERAVDAAHKLHKSLAQSGRPPRHSPQMLKNRHLDPSEREFYLSDAAIEDLLTWIANPTAFEAMTGDATVGKSFTLWFLSRRSRGPREIRLSRTADGWRVRFSGIDQECDETAFPALGQAIEKERSSYPNSLGDWMAFLWDKAANEALSEKQVQWALDRLSSWVNTVTQEAPVKPVWEGVAMPMRGPTPGDS